MNNWIKTDDAGAHPAGNVIMWFNGTDDTPAYSQRGVRSSDGVFTGGLSGDVREPSAFQYIEGE